MCLSSWQIVSSWICYYESLFHRVSLYLQLFHHESVVLTVCYIVYLLSGQVHHVSVILTGCFFVYLAYLQIISSCIRYPDRLFHCISCIFADCFVMYLLSWQVVPLRILYTFRLFCRVSVIPTGCSIVYLVYLQVVLSCICCESVVPTGFFPSCILSSRQFLPSSICSIVYLLC